jgi:DNA-binding NarL/FixJ family response regulator
MVSADAAGTAIHHGTRMNIIRIVLADDHALVRAGIRALLEKLPGIEVVGEAGDGREALELIKTAAPHIVLLDISMPGLGGLEALPRIVRDFPAAKVIILSAHANEEYVLRALRSGAAGYMLKDAAAEELALAIKAVTQNQTYLGPSVSRTVIESYLTRAAGIEGPIEILTPRQREILQLIAEGKNTKEIAGTLGISNKTAEAHRSQLMDRLGIHDVAGLVRFAVRIGLVSVER